MSVKRTPGPWSWRKLGKQWHLLGDHGMRPIVLSRYKQGLSSLTGDHLLVPFDPRHPDAVTIARSAELVELSSVVMNDPGHVASCERSGPDCPVCQARTRITEILAEIAEAEENWERP
jgi:hypothetical protein